MNEELVRAFEEGRRAERARIAAWLRDPTHTEKSGDLVGEMLDRLAGIIEGLEAGVGDECPKCGACEVDHFGPATMYSCGSWDYDRRPGTFREKCGVAP